MSSLKSISEPQQFPKVKFHALNDLHGRQSSVQHAQRRPKVGVQLWSAAQPPPQINARLPEPNLNLWFCFSTFTVVFHCLSNPLEKLTQKRPRLLIYTTFCHNISLQMPRLSFSCSMCLIYVLKQLKHFPNWNKKRNAN